MKKFFQFAGGDEKCDIENYTWNKEKLWNEILQRLGKELRNRLGMQIDDLSAEGSTAFLKGILESHQILEHLLQRKAMTVLPVTKF